MLDANVIMSTCCISQGTLSLYIYRPKRLASQGSLFSQRWATTKIISWTSLTMDMYRDQGIWKCTWSTMLVNNRLRQSFIPSVRNQSNMSISHSYNQKILHITWRRDQEWGTFCVQVPSLWANFREVSHPLWLSDKLWRSLTHKTLAKSCLSFS